MKYLKAIGISVLAIVLLVASQLLADEISSALGAGMDM